MKREEPVITEYAKMWPRAVYNIKSQNRPVQSIKDALHHKTGVYVLYYNEKPYYIGQTKGSLWRRISDHALNHNDKYYNHWNYFSVFVIPDTRHISEIEGILIAAFGETTANSSKRRIRRVQLPADVKKILAKQMVIVMNE